jgi:3-methyladenine DNA glycosylase AlkD
MNKNEIIDELKKVASSEHLSKMSYFGVETSDALGIKTPDIRKIAKRTGCNHELALELWKTEIHEAKLLAAMIADPNQLTESDFDMWVKDFNSWDICDCCCSMFVQVSFARRKIDEYVGSQYEFVKRAAFVLMAYFAIHDKSRTDDFFYPFFEMIERESTDERNFVKKSVNWALRQIGKRNENLRLRAISSAEKIKNIDSKSAHWIASDALRELKNEKIVLRVNSKK